MKPSLNIQASRLLVCNRPLLLQRIITEALTLETTCTGEFPSTESIHFTAKEVAQFRVKSSPRQRDKRFPSLPGRGKR